MSDEEVNIESDVAQEMREAREMREAKYKLYAYWLMGSFLMFFFRCDKSCGLKNIYAPYGHLLAGCFYRLLCCDYSVGRRTWVFIFGYVRLGS